MHARTHAWLRSWEPPCWRRTSHQRGMPPCTWRGVHQFFISFRNLFVQTILFKKEIKYISYLSRTVPQNIFQTIIWLLFVFVEFLRVCLLCVCVLFVVCLQGCAPALRAWYTCRHAYVHTYVRTYVHTDIQTDRPTHTHTHRERERERNNKIKNTFSDPPLGDGEYCHVSTFSERLHSYVPRLYVM